MHELFTYKTVAIFTHVRPDGDALGSMFALRGMLLKCGAHVDCFCDSPLPDYLKYLDVDNIYNVKSSSDVCAYDATVAVDCANLERLGIYQKRYMDGKKKYNIDHHMTNPSYGDINLIKSSASTAEIIFDIIEENAKNTCDKTIASAIYTGIITDTGAFSQANTTAHSHKVAAKLIEFGVDTEWLCDHLIKEMSVNRLAFFCKILSGIRYFEDGKIALLSVLQDDLIKYNLAQSDTEGLVNYARNVIGVKIGICMTQVEPKHFKVSFRSKTGVNVADVAKEFGGGGHNQAAGCCITGLQESCVERIVRAAAFAL